MRARSASKDARKRAYGPPYFNTLQPYLANVAGNVVIALDAATVLTVTRVTVAQLQASDFIF